MERTSVFDLVQRASDRSAAAARVEMKRSIDSLATVAATAPLLGFLGTVLGMLDTFLRGAAGEKTSVMKAIVRSLSESLVPTAVALFVAVVAWAFYRHLSTRLERFGTEMQNASLALANELSRLSGSNNR